MAIKATTGGMIIGNAPKPSVGVVVQKSGKVLGIDSKTLSLGSPTVIGYEEGIITVGVGDIEEVFKNGSNTVYVLLKSLDSELPSEEHMLTSGMVNVEIPLEVPFDTKWEVFACVRIGEVEIKGAPLGLYLPSASIPKPLAPSNPLPPAKPIKETQEIINNLWPEKPMCTWQKDDDGSFIALGSGVLDSQRMRVLVNYPTNTTASVDLLKFYVPQVQVQISLSPTFDTILYTEMDAEVTIPSHSKVTEVPIQLTVLWEAGAIVAEEYYARARVSGGIRTRPPITSEWSEIKSVNVIEEQAPTLSYSSLLFQEAVANDGSITGTATISILGGVYSAGVVNFVDVTGIPDGLMAQIVRDSDTQVSLSFLGNAYNHASANSSPFTVSFISGAFESLTPAEVVGSEQLMQMNFINPALNPSLAYSTTTLSEAVANNGSISGSVVATLTDGIFTSDVTSFISVTGVPSGLTPQLTRTSDTQVSFSLLGSATTHTSANSTVVTLAFTEGAFESLTPAQVLNSQREITLTFANPVAAMSLNYGSTFFEREANDGGFSSSLFIQLTGGDTFVSDVITRISVSNTPTGLTPAFQRVSNTGVVMTLQGTASSHTSASTINNLRVEFLDGAFTNTPAAQVTNSTKNLTISFSDPYTLALVYSSDFFTEAPAGDGSILAPVTINCIGDVFTANASSYISTTNVPSGLTPTFERLNDTQMRFSLVGNALNHASANSVYNINVSFGNSAFTTNLASAILRASRSDIKVYFSGAAPSASLSYSTVSLMESTDNDGSVDDIIIVTLTGDTFAADVVSANKVSMFGPFPSGLTRSFTRDSNTQITLRLTGNALFHTPANSLSGTLGITFQSGSFTNSPFNTVTGYYKTGISLTFRENFKSTLAYSFETFEESVANTGLFDVPLEITISGEDTFAEDINTHVTIPTLPNGLGYTVTRLTSTRIQVELIGPATLHSSLEDTTLQVVFSEGAFSTNTPSAVQGATKTIGISFLDPYIPEVIWPVSSILEGTDGSHSTPMEINLLGDTFTEGFSINDLGVVAPSGLTVQTSRISSTKVSIWLEGKMITREAGMLSISFRDSAFVNTPSIDVINSATGISLTLRPSAITFSATEFLESEAWSEDGVIDTVITATLSGDTFVSNADWYVSTRNMPSGLAPSFTRLSGTELSIGFTGWASNSLASDSITNLFLDFETSAFTSGLLPAGVGGAFKVTFNDPIVSYAWEGPSYLQEGNTLGGFSGSLHLRGKFISAVNTSGITLAGVPTGLTPSISKVDTNIFISFTGVTEEVLGTYVVDVEIPANASTPAAASNQIVQLELRPLEVPIITDEQVTFTDTHVVKGLLTGNIEITPASSLGTIQGYNTYIGDTVDNKEILGSLYLIDKNVTSYGDPKIFVYAYNNKGECLNPLTLSNIDVGTDDLPLSSVTSCSFEDLNILENTYTGQISFARNTGLETYTLGYKAFLGTAFAPTSLLKVMNLVSGNIVDREVSFESTDSELLLYVYPYNANGLGTPVKSRILDAIGASGASWILYSFQPSIDSTSVEYLDRIPEISLSVTPPAGETLQSTDWKILLGDQTLFESLGDTTNLISLPLTSPMRASFPSAKSTLKVQVKCYGETTSSLVKDFAFRSLRFEPYFGIDHRKESFTSTVEMYLEGNPTADTDCAVNIHCSTDSTFSNTGAYVYSGVLTDPTSYSEIDYTFAPGVYHIWVQLEGISGDVMGLESPWKYTWVAVGIPRWEAEILSTDGGTLGAESTHGFTLQYTPNTPEVLQEILWVFNDGTSTQYSIVTTTATLEVPANTLPAGAYTLLARIIGEFSIFESTLPLTLTEINWDLQVTSGVSLNMGVENTFGISYTTPDVVSTSWVLSENEDRTSPLVSSLEDAVNLTSFAWVASTGLPTFVYLHCKSHQATKESEWVTKKLATTSEISSFWDVSIKVSMLSGSLILTSVYTPPVEEAITGISWVISSYGDETFPRDFELLDSTTTLQGVEVPLSSLTSGPKYAFVKVQGSLSTSEWVRSETFVGVEAVSNLTRITKVTP